MNLPIIKSWFDEVLLQLDLGDSFPKRILFWGEEAGGIASYMAGWMAGNEVEVRVVDGANRFDPYMVSSFARKAVIPPERVLKRILIARAFTCYQMATLIERLPSFGGEAHEPPLRRKPYVILLGPVTPFLDEDVSEKEAWSLFERVLKRIEELGRKGVSFFLFQPSVAFNFSFLKGRTGRGVESRESRLLKRLFQFSDLVWKISLEDQQLRMTLVKGAAGKRINKNSESETKSPPIVIKGASFSYP